MTVLLTCIQHDVCQNARDIHVCLWRQWNLLGQFRVESGELEMGKVQIPE